MRRSASIAAAIAAAAVTPALAGSSEVTISVQNAILRWGQQATLYGSIASTKADEKIVIEVKECGLPGADFRSLAWAYTQAGGGWSLDMGARVSSQYRAVWGDARSASVKVQQRPYVTVVIRPGNRGAVGVNAIYPFWGKRVSIQVFDKNARVWKQVQTVKLTEQGGGGGYVWTSGKFRPKVPKNAQMRGVLSLAQAKPCYLAGY
ncbi:MAG: hypothetical protein ACRDNP_13910, partial [Gaiellaceae bacterium]